MRRFFRNNQLSRIFNEGELSDTYPIRLLEKKCAKFWDMYIYDDDNDDVDNYSGLTDLKPFINFIKVKCILKIFKCTHACPLFYLFLTIKFIFKILRKKKKRQLSFFYNLKNFALNA